MLLLSSLSSVAFERRVERPLERPLARPLALPPSSPESSAKALRRMATSRFMMRYLPTSMQMMKKRHELLPVAWIAGIIASIHSPVMRMNTVSIAGPK